MSLIYNHMPTQNTQALQPTNFSNFNANTAPAFSNSFNNSNYSPDLNSIISLITQLIQNLQQSQNGSASMLNMGSQGNYGANGGMNNPFNAGGRGNLGANGAHSHNTVNGGMSSPFNAGGRGNPAANGAHSHNTVNGGMNNPFNAPNAGGNGNFGVNGTANLVQGNNMISNQNVIAKQNNGVINQVVENNIFNVKPNVQTPKTQPIIPQPAPQPIVPQQPVTQAVPFEIKKGNGQVDDIQGTIQQLIDQGYTLRRTNERTGTLSYQNKDMKLGQRNIHITPTKDENGAPTNVGTQTTSSPIALDMNNDGKISTTGETTAKERLANTALGETRQFDIDNNGSLDTVEWMTGNGDALLTDEDGKLFGDEGGKYNNGYEKLALRDADKDGQLTGQELAGLQLWADNGDAKQDAGEFVSAIDAGVTRLSVDMNLEANARGENLMRSDATINGNNIMTEDVWFGKA